MGKDYSVFKKILKLLFFLILFCIVGIPLLVFLVLEVPAVQSFVLHKVQHNISQKIQSKVSIHNVQIDFPNGISLEDLYIEDQHKDTLIYAHQLNVDLNILKLLSKKVVITDVELEDALINVYRKSGQKDYNYSFIPKAFSTKNQPNTKSNWEFEVRTVDLSKVRIMYEDIPAGIFFHSGMHQVAIDIGDLGVDNQHTVIDHVSLSKVVVALDFLKPEFAKQKETDADSNPFHISLSNLKINDCRIIYNDFTKKELTKRFDYNRIDAKKLNGLIEKVNIHGSDFLIKLNQLSMEDKSGLTIQNLVGSLAIDKNYIHIGLDRLVTPNSNVSHTLTSLIPLDSTKMGELAFNGSFAQEVIGIKDVAYFLPQLDTIKQLRNKKIQFGGDLQGSLKNFSFQNMSVALDKRNSIHGNLTLKGLPNLNATYINLDLKKLFVQSAILASFTKVKDSTIHLTGLGQLALSGKVKGSVKSLEGKLMGITDAGKVSMEGKVSFTNEFSLEEFDGSLITDSFQVSNILPSTGLGKVSVRAVAQGNLNKLFTFDIKASSIQYQNYTYTNIALKGDMKDSIIHSTFTSNDKNIVTDLAFAGDLAKKQFAVDGTISKLDLYATHLYPTPLLLSSTINSSVTGLDIDSLIGFAKLHNLYLSDGNISVTLDSIVADASLTNGNHRIQVMSPIFEGQIDGHYNLSELPGVFDYLINQYYSNYKLPKQKQLKETENIEVYFKGGDLTKLATLFNPAILNLDSVNIYTLFNKKENQIVINSSLRHFEMENMKLNRLKLNVDGKYDSLDFKFTAANFASGKSLIINAPFLAGSYSNGRSIFNLRLHDQNSPTKLNVDGTLALANDSVLLRIIHSDILLRGKAWKLDSTNRILVGEKTIDIRNLNFSQNDQLISVNSHGSINSNELEAVFQKVDLSGIFELIGASSYHVKGFLNGKVKASNLFTDQALEAGLRIDSFYLNNQKIGELHLSGKKLPNDGFASLDCNLLGVGNNATVHGKYYLKNQGLEFQVHIAPLQLQPFEPFVKSFAYHITGAVSGDFQLTGTVDKPILIGELLFNNGNEVGLTATHTIYKVRNQKISFTTTTIDLNKFTVTDSLHNQATISGSIIHDHFNDMQLALKLDTDNFQLINSTYSQTAAVYGKMNAKVHASVNGLVEDLHIRMFITALKGTQLFVPLTGTQANSVTPSYIHFNKIEPMVMNMTNPADSVTDRTLTINKHKVDLSKFDVAGQFRINKESEVNILIDPNNGDKITARGDGLFSLDFDSQNNINLYGTYTIDKGSYSFSFVNLIKKEFKIDKGSTISWTGDPTNANLDITAIYETRASRYELLNDQDAFMTKDQADAAKRPLPVDVYLLVKGSLTTPDISFDIKVPEGSDPLTGNLVVQKINQIKSDPNELNKQAFSLIVTNKFMSSQGSSSIGGSGSNVALNEVNTSVSKLLNSQLNRLSDDYLKGVNITVNLQSLDQNTYGAFAQNAQILATKELNSHFTVSAGGNVNVNSNYGSNQFAGDYSIYYKINQSGSVSLKFFRTNLQNIYTTNLYTQQGFSVNLKREYNKWKNIFRRTRRRKEEHSY